MAGRRESDTIVAISNTGPLVSALQCDGADLLRQYFSVVCVTASEMAELKRHGWAEAVRSLIDDAFVVVVEPLNLEESEEAERIAKEIAAQPTSGDPEWHNHLPEAEAMAVMKLRPKLLIDLILLDENAARRVAQEMGLRFTGFPGVLARAGMDGLITAEDIRRLLKTCQQRGTHYGDALIETVAHRYGR